MKSRTTFVQLVLIILALSLAACTRSASTAPESAEMFPAPAATQAEGMGVLEGLMTETAIAAGGQAPIEAGTPVATTDPSVAGALPTLPVLAGEATPTIDPAVAILPSPTPEILVAPQAQPTVVTIRPATYTLQKGEFPYCIARRFNVNPADLLALNNLGLAQSSMLQPGLVLQIPNSGAFTADRALKAHPVQYTVLAGDSIYSVACLFGDVDPVNIAAVNGLSSPFTLSAGQVLQIP